MYVVHVTKSKIQGRAYLEIALGLDASSSLTPAVQNEMKGLVSLTFSHKNCYCSSEPIVLDVKFFIKIKKS